MRVRCISNIFRKRALTWPHRRNFLAALFLLANSPPLVSCGTAFYFEPNGQTDQPCPERKQPLWPLSVFFSAAFWLIWRNSWQFLVAKLMDFIDRRLGNWPGSIDAFESVSSPSPSASVRSSKIDRALLFLFVPAIDSVRVVLAVDRRTTRIDSNRGCPFFSAKWNGTCHLSTNWFWW